MNLDIILSIFIVSRIIVMVLIRAVCHLINLNRSEDTTIKQLVHYFNVSLDLFKLRRGI